MGVSMSFARGNVLPSSPRPGGDGRRGPHRTPVCCAKFNNAEASLKNTGYRGGGLEKSHLRGLTSKPFAWQTLKIPVTYSLQK